MHIFFITIINIHGALIKDSSTMWKKTYFYIVHSEYNYAILHSQIIFRLWIKWKNSDHICLFRPNLLKMFCKNWYVKHHVWLLYIESVFIGLSFCYLRRVNSILGSHNASKNLAELFTQEDNLASRAILDIVQRHWTLTFNFLKSAKKQFIRLGF